MFQAIVRFFETHPFKVAGLWCICSEHKAWRSPPFKQGEQRTFEMWCLKQQAAATVCNNKLMLTATPKTI